LKYFADANKYLFDYYGHILLGWKATFMIPRVILVSDLQSVGSTATLATISNCHM